MKSRMPFVLTLAGLTVALVAFAAGSAVFQKKGESSFTLSVRENGQKTYMTKERRFEHVASFGESEMLLDIEKTSSYTDGLEGTQGQLTAKAFVNDVEAFDKIVWTIKDQAQAYEITVDPELFITEYGACCGAEDTHRAFDLRSGRYLLSYNAFLLPASHWERLSPFSIEIPNSSILRLIGVLSASAVRDLPELSLRAGEQLVGVVTYASLNGPIARAVITVKGGMNFYPSVVGVELIPSLNGHSRSELRDGRHLILWDLDGVRESRQVSGFGLRLNAYLDRETQILIPITNDRIDVQAVQAPVGVRISLLK